MMDRQVSNNLLRLYESSPTLLVPNDETDHGLRESHYGNNNSSSGTEESSIMKAMKEDDEMEDEDLVTEKFGSLSLQESLDKSQQEYLEKSLRESLQEPEKTSLQDSLKKSLNESMKSSMDGIEVLNVEEHFVGYKSEGLQRRNPTVEDEALNMTSWLVTQESSIMEAMKEEDYTDDFEVLTVEEPVAESKPERPERSVKGGLNIIRWVAIESSCGDMQVLCLETPMKYKTGNQSSFLEEIKPMKAIKLPFKYDAEEPIIMTIREERVLCALLAEAFADSSSNGIYNGPEVFTGTEKPKNSLGASASVLKESNQTNNILKK